MLVLDVKVGRGEESDEGTLLLVTLTTLRYLFL